MTLTTPDRTDALAERLFGATLGALELFSIYLGAELGLYHALTQHGPLTYGELADRAGIAPRYAREWLEQQAVAGLLDVEHPDAAADARRYALAPDHARVLVDPDDPAHVAPFAHMLAGIGGVLPQVADAYRTGGGVPYAAYGRAFRHGQGHINRPAFTHELPSDWLAAMPDVVARLESAQHPRVADLGCGQGFSTLAIAGAFLNAWVDGLDVDAGLDRRRPPPRRARRPRRPRALPRGRRQPSWPPTAPTTCPDPRGAARHDRPRRRAGAPPAPRWPPGGTVLVVDERVADTFTAPGDEVERMMYGWSVTHCLPTQLAEQPSAALGTVMRADTVRELAAEAGYARVEVLPVENDFFRLYRLHP